jgi:hypothetical protein
MAWKKLAFTDEIVTNPLTADLDMDGHDILNCDELKGVGDVGWMRIKGGDGLDGGVYLYGKNHATLPGRIYFYVPDAAKTAHTPAGYFDGATDTPQLHLTHNLDMSSKKIEELLAGTAASDAIRKDQALLLDGTQAMAADLNFNKKNADAMCIEPLASAPGTPGTAQIYYNTGDDHLYVNVV